MFYKVVLYECYDGIKRIGYVSDEIKNRHLLNKLKEKKGESQNA